MSSLVSEPAILGFGACPACFALACAGARPRPGLQGPAGVLGRPVLPIARPFPPTLPPHVWQLLLSKGLCLLGLGPAAAGGYSFTHRLGEAEWREQRARMARTMEFSSIPLGRSGQLSG